MYGSCIKKRKLLEKIVLHIKSDPNDDDVESTNKDNIESIKQDMKEMIDFNNTMTYHSDGTIVITPQYSANLPNEILDKILDYLYALLVRRPYKLQHNRYQLCLVNKRFYQQVNRLLWHTPMLYSDNRIEQFITCLTNAERIQQWTTPSDGCNDGNHYPVPYNILTAKHHVRRLDIRSNYWNTIRLTMAMPCLNLLETLDITSAEITDTVLTYLPRYCPHLTTLLLIDDMIMHPSCLDAIVQHCHQLRHLEFSIDQSIRTTVFHIFHALAQCPSLTTLRLHISGNERGASTSYLDENAIRHLTRLHQLTTIAFVGVKMKPTMDLFLTTVDMTTIWPRLSSLTIDGGKLLTDAIMIPFIESHPHIQSLDLSKAQFSDATLDKIATHLPHMTHIRIVLNHIITSVGVYHLIQHCLDLKQAEFSKCTPLVHSMIEFSAVGRNGKAALSLEQMKTIRQRNIN